MAADVTRHRGVNLLSLLLARQAHFVGIDHHHKVSRVHVRGKDRLVLAAENRRDAAGKAAQSLAFGVDNVPFAVDFFSRKRVCKLLC